MGFCRVKLLTLVNLTAPIPSTSKLYNDQNEVNEEFLDNIQDSCNSENIPGIGEDEVLAAITKLKHRKAVGLDNISAEETTQRSGLTAVHRLCSMAWEQEQIPSDWKSAVIIPVNKKKDTLDCSNYRQISLLCHCKRYFHGSTFRESNPEQKKY